MAENTPQKPLRSAGVENLTPTEFIKHAKVMSDIQVRERTVEFLRRALGWSIAATFILIFLQGFGVGGFNLSESFLNWLGGATVAQIGGLLVMAYKG